MTFPSWSKVLASALMIPLVSLAGIAQAPTKSSAKYDKAAEVRFKGTVTEVKESGGSEPVILTVKTADKGVTTVQLAPRDYLKEINCWLKSGDQVEITGAKVADSTDTVLAREIVFGNSTMVLRDDKGTPVWELWKPAKSGG